MNLQKNYLLLLFGTIMFLITLILISTPLFSNINVTPFAIWDFISLLLVNISACFLLMTAFGFIKKMDINLFYYKLIWMQDILIILGLVGMGLGFVFLLLGMFTPPPPGVDPTAKLIGSMAIALLTIIYGFIGAVVYYLIQKYYESKNNLETNFKLIIPMIGFKMHSIIYFLLFFSIFLFASYIGLINTGITLKEIFPIDAIIFFICVNTIFILLYKDNFFMLIKNIFWYTSDQENIIQYNIKFIRNIKKITSIIIYAILIITPVVLLASLGVSPENLNNDWGSVASIVLTKVGIYYIYLIMLIIIFYIIEAKEICKLYLLNGKMYPVDRFYVLTYIFPSAIVLYILLFMCLYWSTLPF